jgi:hypothetical protein
VLPDSPAKARFLNHDEKIIAFERLRANNQVSSRSYSRLIADVGLGN